MALFPRAALGRSSSKVEASETTGPIISQGILSDYVTRNAPKMIVTRMQDHIVETSDGNLHMAINLSGDRNLTILTSTDNGGSWSVTGRLPDSASNGSSDIRLVEGEDTMLLVYTTASGGITYCELGFTAEGRWRVTETSQVVSSGIDPASTHPTIIQGGNGNLLVAYNVETETGLQGVLAGSATGESWVRMVGLDPTVTSGALRVLATPDGFGVIYANANEIYWITYDDTIDDFRYEIIHEEGAVGVYASHFSTTTVGDDIFLAAVAPDLSLNVLHYDAQTQTWSDAETPAGVGIDEVSSVQMSADADGDLYLTYDDYETGLLKVITSSDEGETWTEVATLDVPDIFRSDTARFEAPEHFDGELVIFYQFGFPLAGAATGLYYFTLDTETGSVSAAPQAEVGTASPALEDVALF